MTRIFVAGGVSYDTIITLENLPEPKSQTIHYSHYKEQVGSTGSGKAVALHRLGFDTTLQAMIGDDAEGQKIKDYFKQVGVKFLYDYDPKGTERHTNIMDKDGRRISIYTHSATFDINILNRLHYYGQQITENTDILVLNIINYCRRFIYAAKSSSTPIWCDIHDYDGKNPYHQDFINAADFIFMSSDNMPDYKPFMEKMIAMGKRLVVCTHGKDGASAFDGEWFEIPALTYELVDSNGAGDNFFSGFLYGYVQGFHTEKCLQLATIAGGLCVTSEEIASPELSDDKLLSEWYRHYG